MFVIGLVYKADLREIDAHMGKASTSSGSTVSVQFSSLPRVMTDASVTAKTPWWQA